MIFIDTMNIIRINKLSEKILSPVQSQAKLVTTPVHTQAITIMWIPTGYKLGLKTVLYLEKFPELLAGPGHAHRHTPVLIYIIFSC